MSWLDVEVDLGGSRRGRVQWSVTLKQGGARITVPNTIIEALGWTQQTALKLQIGAGDKAGSLRIVADSKGPLRATKPYANAKSLQYRLGIWQGMPEDQDQIAIRHEVLDGALVLHLPTVAHSTVQTAVSTVTKPIPLAPRPQPATTPRPASIMADPPPERPAARKVDVTSRFVNDPKPQPAMASGVRGARIS